MRKSLFFIIWLVFIFLLLEITGFIYFKLRASKPISGYGYPAGLIVSHPVLGFQYQPGFAGYFKGSDFQQIPIQINSHGFRDDSFNEKSADRHRLAVLGDSVVFSPGVHKGERFTECLEQRIPAGEAGVDIMNLGVNSYTFGHYLAIAQQDYMDTSPDAVIIGITLNDFEPMDNSGILRRLKREAAGLTKPIWFARIQERLGRTYAARFIDEFNSRFTYALMNADEKEAYHTKWMRTVVKAWTQPENSGRFSRGLSQFKDLMDTADIPYAFILFPELNDIKEPDKYAAPRQTVLKELDNRNLPYCDPYNEFAKAEAPDSLFLQRDSIHLNPAGHTLLCSAILRCMEQGNIALGLGSGTVYTGPWIDLKL